MIRTLSILLCVLLHSCAPVITNVSINDRPIPNNVLRASILDTGIVIDAAFIKYFYIPEDDELLESFEYLEMKHDEVLVVERTNLKELCLEIHIHNPNKFYYQLWAKQCRELEDGSETGVRPIYKGNLSFKSLVLRPHIGGNKKEGMAFDIRDREGGIIFSGPEIIYTVF